MKLISKLRKCSNPTSDKEAINDNILFTAFASVKYANDTLSEHKSGWENKTGKQIFMI